MILPTRLIRHTPNGGYMLQILSDDAWTSNILKNVIVKVFMTVLVSVLVSEIDVFWGACSKNHLQKNCTCLTKKLEVHALFRCLTDTWERFQENWIIFVDSIVCKSELEKRCISASWEDKELALSGSLWKRCCPQILLNFLEIVPRCLLDIWKVHEPPTFW